MRIIVAAALLSLAACGVETSAVPGDLHEQSATEGLSAGGAQPALTGTCAPQSAPICAGQPIGAICRLNPQASCLPSNELPNGGILCLCQGQSTI